MKRERQIGRWFFAALIVLLLPVTTAWGYFFDDRREMSLSGFAYSRVAMATSKDNMRSYKGLYRVGNIVQHRNFLTLEWRHDIGRVSREIPTVGPFFQFLNFDKFDYYLNMREEYDGVWDYGPPRMRRQLDGGGGATFWDKYYGRQTPKYPGQFGRFRYFEYITNIKRLEKLVNKTQLFEWYFNVTKGPLFIRIGRQNLSWGETDGFRLLDQINPLNNNFGGFLTSLDERRVPLNMLRAQWSFGTVGPIGDLTLEGFVSPGRTTGSQFVAQGFFWNQGHSSPSNLETYRMPCGGPVFGHKSPGPTLGSRPQDTAFGMPCSFRPQGPHNRLSDSRGGGRLVGTIHDFTFSLAHYYTWHDNVLSAGAVLAPTPAHLAWDLGQSTFEKLTGKPAFDASGKPINNPWGPNDQTVGANGVTGGPGGITRTVGGSGAATPAAVERSIAVPLRTKRVQISGASLSFPVNALTGMFVGSDNPLYYIYTTFRAEAAYFRNVPFRAEYHDAQQYLQRFMTLPLYNAGVRSTSQNPFFQPEYLPKAINPNAHFSSEGNCTDRLGVRGCRIGRMKSRDVWGFNIGLDHNQWIRFLNPNNTFTFTTQLFKNHTQGFHDRFKTNRPAGLLNDMFISNVKSTRAAIGPNRTNPKLVNRVQGPGFSSNMCIPVSGPNPPCQYSYLERSPADSELFTFSVSTQYYGGNVRPSFTLFYDWRGGYLFQPGFDWTFYDPFRVSIRYNYIGGAYAGAIGIAKDLNTAWFELQYLLY